MVAPSLVPRPSPKSGKRVWCSERQFLSHGAGPYFVKNFIIAYLYPELEFLTPQSIRTTTQPSLQKLETAAESIGTAENRLRDSFSLFPIRFKIRSLTSCNYNEVFCNLIGDLKSEIGPAPCDKKCCSEHINTRPSLHVREGLGTRLGSTQTLFRGSGSETRNGLGTRNQLHPRRAAHRIIA